MKYLLVLVALAAIFAIAFGSDCEFRGKSMSVGEKYSPEGECSIYECQSGGGVTGKTCPSFASLEPCDNKPDITKPYPECCPQPC